ncbi:hypothetical protein [Teredinibacter turnerae]|uniref:hypothetical protein n=1 Tax=Teredinibacter turnerae TaxID=2426 RepID=UPI0003FC408C|nr:hypothetical protein [Teredinibacter turnerae]
MKFGCCLIALLWLSGCASNTYVYGTQGRDAIDGEGPPTINPIIVGEPHRFLDASDWIWPGSLLAKLVLWNKKVDSHEVSAETIDVLAEYLARNELDDVQVLVNTYKPGVQWSRTFRNREIGGFWRFTLGIFNAVGYTILPGRFFGGDHFNPYSNTISIYSDIPSVLLHEGGHAKDFNSRKYKGIYSAIYGIPGVALYHEAVASNEALSYLHDNCDLSQEKSAYHALHPAYGTYVGGTFGYVVPVTYLTAAFALPGHVTGAVAASKAELKPGCAQQPESPAASVAADANPMPVSSQAPRNSF